MIDELTSINDLDTSLSNFIKTKAPNFKYPEISKFFLRLNKTILNKTRNNRRTNNRRTNKRSSNNIRTNIIINTKQKSKRVSNTLSKVNKQKNKLVLYGMLWYYVYTLESSNPMETLRQLGFSNCFLFIKQVVQVKLFKQLGLKYINIVFNNYFCKDLDDYGIPNEMVRGNIYEPLGMLQWLYIGSPHNLNKLCGFLTKICNNLDRYPNFLKWKWLDFETDINKVFQENHYIQTNGVFTLFYGLFITEWVYYNLEFIKSKIDISNQGWISSLNRFKQKLTNKNLSLKNFVICLMKIKSQWNPNSNTYKAWLVNHIPYFFSAFYHYDLRKIPEIKHNNGFNKIIKFMEISMYDIKDSSNDYYGECVEMLHKLGYSYSKQLLEIQNNIINKKTRIKILKLTGRPFSDIHTIVTYVMQPNSNDVLNTEISGYGLYIKEILEAIKDL